MIPSRLTEVLDKLGARLDVQTTGQEGFWGVLHQPNQTHDVAILVAGETIHVFQGEQLLMPLSRDLLYLDHEAFGASPLEGLHALLQVRNHNFLLPSALGLWSLPLRDDFSLKG